MQLPTPASPSDLCSSKTSPNTAPVDATPSVHEFCCIQWLCASSRYLLLNPLRRLPCCLRCLFQCSAAVLYRSMRMPCLRACAAVVTLYKAAKETSLSSPAVSVRLPVRDYPCLSRNILWNRIPAFSSCRWDHPARQTKNFRLSSYTGLVAILLSRCRCFLHDHPRLLSLSDSFFLLTPVRGHPQMIAAFIKLSWSLI